MTNGENLNLEYHHIALMPAITFTSYVFFPKLLNLPIVFFLIYKGENNIYLADNFVKKSDM